VTVLNHVRRGSGEPLLLIHGTGSRWEVWGPVLDALAARHDVIAVDLPGFGRSPRLPGAATVSTLADALESFLGELGVERPHVAGNSLGGWLTLELAQRGAARSAIPISPSGFWNPAERRYVKSSLIVTRRVAQLIAPRAEALLAPAAVRTLLLAQVLGRPWRMPADDAAHTIRGVAESTAFDEILDWQVGNTYDARPIDVPVTIAWGVRDRLLFPRQGRVAERVVAGAKLVPLRGCGHVPTWDDPPLVARTILEGVARAASPVSHVAGR
jgi:pimeloyl-ACP methyl ester carboxylesterase